MQRLVHGVVAATLAAGTCVGALAAELRYRLQDLNELTGLENIWVQSLNNQGDFTLVDRDSERSYLWRGGRLHDLGAWGFGTLTLNERGEVAGTRLMDDGRRLPFVWRDGRFIDPLAGLGASAGEAHDINESGHVVGEADGRAFVWDGTRSRYLDIPGTTAASALAINDRGVIAGGLSRAGDQWLEERGYLLRDGQVQTLPEPILFEWTGAYRATEINNAGSTIVSWDDHNWGEYGSTLYVGGTRFDLGYGTFARDINEHDWAAGYSVFEVQWDEYEFSALVFHDGQRLSVSKMLTPEANARWDWLEYVSAINDRGQLLGDGRLADGRTHAFIATPVPEAQAVATMLAGLGVLGAAMRGRRRGQGRRA
ncbi:hypothetical protein [uncultured Azohydromonas sp.]|jgi:Predicted integral membrane proteins containing uncharacterized repeats|uniref:hypothetical protein n=1 Tax=uncultured Azohydromonas sp. TaxID=487342 RepID=UPI0026202B15|nr:hypothetical protein [uncultured Azohydromonas sp.]